MQAGAAAVGRPHRQWEGARVTPPVSLKLKALTLGFNPKRKKAIGSASFIVRIEK
jgi:hypothetical protein